MSKVRISIILLVSMLLSAFVVFTQNASEQSSSPSIPYAENNSELLEPRYERLVPNSLYSEWCDKIAGNLKTDPPCLTPHGSKHAFISDSAGGGMISLQLSSSTLDTANAYFEVVIAFQGTKQSEGESTGAIAVSNPNGTLPMWFSFLPNHQIPDLATNNLQSIDWTSPNGKGRYTKNGDHATLELSFAGLIPHAQYSLWCVAITHSLEQQISEQPCT